MNEKILIGQYWGECYNKAAYMFLPIDINTQARNMSMEHSSVILEKNPKVPPFVLLHWALKMKLTT